MADSVRWLRAEPYGCSECTTLLLTSSELSVPRTATLYSFSKLLMAPQSLFFPFEMNSSEFGRRPLIQLITTTHWLELARGDSEKVILSRYRRSRFVLAEGDATFGAMTIVRGLNSLPAKPLGVPSLGMSRWL
ncbi:hypothetical protein MRX96_010532 [Rhipicephalus microplus]